jgi:hypothetical protein
MRLLNTNYRRTRVLGERVVVPTFEIVSCPSIRITDLKRMRFNVIDRMRDAAMREIRQANDDALEYAVKRSSTLGPVDVIPRPPNAW